MASLIWHQTQAMVRMSSDVAVKQGEGSCSRIQSIEKRTFYGNTSAEAASEMPKEWKTDWRRRMTDHADRLRGAVWCHLVEMRSGCPYWVWLPTGGRRLGQGQDSRSAGRHMGDESSAPNRHSFRVLEASHALSM